MLTTKRFYIAVIWGALAFWGCSDNSSTDDAAPEPECREDADCSSHVCLEDGSCAHEANKGEACDARNICKEGLKCVSGTCQPPEEKKEPEKKPECTQDEDCKEGLACIDNACKERPIVITEPSWDSAQDCEEEICPEGYICNPDNHKCAKPVKGQENCSEDLAWCVFGECKNAVCVLTDPDGDAKLSDKDGDTIADYYDSCDEDTDNDGKANCEDLDSDADTIPDYLESRNGGNILNEPEKISEEAALDCSSCPIYAFQNTDSDGNGIPDSEEASWVNPNSGDTEKYVTEYDDSGDKWTIVRVDGEDKEIVGASIDPVTGKVMDESGNVVQITNSDGEQVDLILVWSDIDGDTIPDHLDTETDNDSASDIEEIAGIQSSLNSDSPHPGRKCDELCVCEDEQVWCDPGTSEKPWDSDGDTIMDYMDKDSDGDGIPDEIEGLDDTDGDGVLDRYSLDSDGDGVSDADEGFDEQGNPIKNENGEYCYKLKDCDHDGLDDKSEKECLCVINNTEQICPSDPTKVDTDGDSAPDVLECAIKTHPNDPASNPQALGQFVFYAPYQEEITPKVHKLSFETAIQTVDMQFVMDTSWTMLEEGASLRDNLPAMMHELKCVQTTKPCTQNHDCNVLEDTYIANKSAEEKAKLKGAICSEKGFCIQNPAYIDTVTIPDGESTKEIKIDGCFNDIWTGISIYTITDSYSNQINLAEATDDHVNTLVKYLADKVALQHEPNGGFNGNYEAAYQPPLCAVLNPGEDKDLCMHKESHIWKTLKSIWLSAKEMVWECNLDPDRIGCAGFRKNAVHIILHAFDENQCLVYLDTEYNAFYKDSGVSLEDWKQDRTRRCMRFKNEVGSVLQSKRVRYIGLYSECYANNLSMYDEQELIETVAKKIGTDSKSVDANNTPFVYQAFDNDLAAKAVEGIRAIARNMPMEITSNIEDIDVKGVSELVKLLDVIPTGGETVQNRICAEVVGNIQEAQECETNNGITKCDGINDMLPGRVVCYDVVPVLKQTKFKPADEVKIYQARVMIKGDGSVLNSAIVNFVVPPKSYQPVN